MERKHYYWIDNIKIFACLFVLLGHFFQSMTKSGIIPSNALYQWFNQTIYYFHVPLFFVCSGFLYQKFSKVDSLASWKSNVIKKAVALGVPYFTFSFATWLLKTVFAGSANDAVGGLGESLFLQPISPYWFLYCLFFIFLITPTFKNVKAALIATGVALLMRIVRILGGDSGLYLVQTVLSNEIWFVLGMMLVFVPIKSIKKWISTILVVLFIALSVFAQIGNWNSGFTSFVIALIAVIGFLLVFNNCNRTNAVLSFFSEYTMPVFLMHTLFAAPTRVVLLKVGITAWPVHVFGGIIVSIAGPVMVMMVMHKTFWLEFFVNPWKVINGKRQDRG